ncbi:MAG TPA: hypothetical protein VGN79_12400 [Devosia sp.]|jgi:hypothetical protein|nr:hypothetical protein [Devosia sp.]
MSLLSMSSPSGDGCTLFPDGNWRHCCDAHDLAYTLGGDKVLIDLELASCVAQTGNGLAALIMLLGLTAGGWLWWWKARRADKP